MRDDSLVMDTSALAAVIFHEPEAISVEKRLKNGIWFSPTLIDYEIGSVLLKKLKLYPEKRQALMLCHDAFLDLPLERVETPIDSVIPIAEKHDLTIYDACYLWLAETLKAQLITLDKKLLSCLA